MILIFTPVHNAFKTAMQTIATIDLITPAPFIHYIGDDFSSPPDSEFYAHMAGDARRGFEIVGERRVYHCGEIGCTESPNLGASLGNMFDIAREMQPEALWIIESDVIPRAGSVGAYREAERLAGESCGGVTPLFTDVGGNRITSFGGMSGGPEGGEKYFLDLEIGQEIGSWGLDDTPRLDVVWWSHLASLWIPIAALNMRNSDGEYVIHPDPEFTLYYCDHDLSYQMREAGLDIVISDKLVAGHSRFGASTVTRWPDDVERTNIERSDYARLKEKWEGSN